MCPLFIPSRRMQWGNATFSSCTYRFIFVNDYKTLTILHDEARSDFLVSPKFSILFVHDFDYTSLTLSIMYFRILSKLSSYALTIVLLVRGLWPSLHVPLPLAVAEIIRSVLHIQRQDTSASYSQRMEIVTSRWSGRAPVVDHSQWRPSTTSTSITSAIR